MKKDLNYKIMPFEERMKALTEAQDVDYDSLSFELKEALKEVGKLWTPTDVFCTFLHDPETNEEVHHLEAAKRYWNRKTIKKLKGA